MKSSRKHPRKAPTSPETDKPFFQGDRTSEPPFFSGTKTVPVQPKLTIGKPNDPYEQEADAIAHSVMNQPSKASISSSSENQVRRQTAEEDETAQTKPELMRMEEEEPVQAKPDLMRMEKEEEVQAKPDLMQMEQEEEVQAKPDLMRMEQEEEPVQVKAKTNQPAQPDLSQRLRNSKGNGNPLPEQVQAEMGQLFNYDFSDVTIHTGAEAVQMTRKLKAQAFTHDKDIYFNAGKYNPDTSSGKELLVHELTHFVQQNPPQSTKPQGSA